MEITEQKCLSLIAWYFILFFQKEVARCKLQVLGDVILNKE